MTIYTKQGDAGKSSIIGGEKQSKSNAIFEVLGTLDELNAQLGFLHTSRLKDIKKTAIKIQNDLFKIGAVVATSSATAKDFDFLIPLTLECEKTIDFFDSKNPPLKNFILPGGSNVSAQLHLTRAVCRRLERLVVVALPAPALLQYLNRLSDLLFVLARFANTKLGVKEEIWNNA